MKLKNFMFVVVSTLLLGCVGYSYIDVITSLFDSGGVWSLVGVVAFLGMIGVGYWYASLVNKELFPKVSKILNLAIFVVTVACLVYSTVTLFASGRVVLPIMFSIIVIAGGLYVFFRAAKKKIPILE